MKAQGSRTTLNRCESLRQASRAMGSTRERSGSLTANWSISSSPTRAGSIDAAAADSRRRIARGRLSHGSLLRRRCEYEGPEREDQAGVVMDGRECVTSPILPGTLGPRALLQQPSAACNATTNFSWWRIEGRLAIIIYEASQCSMDLRRFPFDWQVLCPALVTISHWRQLDCAAGSVPHPTYRLVPLRRKDEACSCGSSALQQ